MIHPNPPHFVPLHSSKASIPSCEFIPLHVVTKNLQSIRSEDRLADFCCELDNASFDFMLLTETWRSEKEESFVTSNLHRAYLSGGEERRGVGIVVSEKNILSCLFTSDLCTSLLACGKGIQDFCLLFSYCLGP